MPRPDTTPALAPRIALTIDDLRVALRTIHRLNDTLTLMRAAVEGLHARVTTNHVLRQSVPFLVFLATTDRLCVALEAACDQALDEQHTLVEFLPTIEALDNAEGVTHEAR